MGVTSGTAIRQLPLEAFANTDLAQPIGLFEDIAKEVLPLFLDAIELCSLASANSSWKNLLRKRFTHLVEDWKKHSFLKQQIDAHPQKEQPFNIIEALFMDIFETAKPLAQTLGYAQELKTTPLDEFPDFIEDLNLVAFCQAIPNHNKPPKKHNETLSGYGTRLRTWIKYTPTLAQLIVLYLSERELTILPKEIGFFTGIEFLYLGDNRLSTLPDSIGRLTRLRGLYTEDNKLRSLPDSIGNLTELNYLHLQYNQLKTLPESFGNLTGLRSLILRENPLSALPKSIRNLTHLNAPWAEEIKMFMERIKNFTRTSQKRKEPPSDPSRTPTKRVLKTKE